MSSNYFSLKIRKAVEAYDMDKTSNRHVTEALRDLSNLVRQAGIEYVPFSWNPEYKGIDDYLYSRKIEQNLRGAA